MKHRVALVSDFFHPNVGGVENHIFQLAQSIMARGHKVIVVTHSYEKKVGLHFLTGMLKVYYLPLIIFYNQCILPTILPTLPMIRTILLSENITIVHGHSSFSTLAHEAMFHAKTLGIRTVFTDHSLFGFADGSSILTNKLLELSLADTNHVICVSHTSKENTVLRANLPPEDVFVIPNAIDPTTFVPSDANDESDRCIRIVVMSRLVYRKGMDLLARIIPPICKRHKYVDFVIGGDGPKRLLLDEMSENHQLQDRVTLLGGVEHDRVPAILRNGHIFLNTSLTEAFCMAIVEAACCGLQVVSTKVGGIPEVLPDEVIHLAEPCLDSLLSTLEEVIDNIKCGQVLPAWETHKIVTPLYTWPKVAQRTEKVYDATMHQNAPSFNFRLNKLSSCGPIIGKIFSIFIVIDYILCILLDWLQPIPKLQKTAENQCEAKEF